MNSSTSHVFSVRLSDSEKQIIDDLAEAKAISRSEAVRLAIHVARPLLISSTGININRVLVSLELLVADCIDRVDRRDPEMVTQLLQIAAKRVDEFHA